MTGGRALGPGARGRTLPPRRLLLPLALIALLGIVAIAASGHRAPEGGSGDRWPGAVFDYLLLGYLVIGTVVCVVLMYLVIRYELPERKPSARRQFRQIATFVAVIFLLAFFIGGRRLDVFDRLGLGGGGSAATTTTTPAPGEPARPQADRSGRPEFRWLPAAAIGMVLVAGGVLWLAVYRRTRAVADDEAEMADALAAVLDDALADLRNEIDPRRAVIAAYARMEALLASHGVRRRPSEAPFEYLARVLTELEVSPGAVFDLTELFERAKFSSQEIGHDLRDEAIAALQAVRDELAPQAVAA